MASDQRQQAPGRPCSSPSDRRSFSTDSKCSRTATQERPRKTSLVDGPEIVGGVSKRVQSCREHTEPSVLTSIELALARPDPTSGERGFCPVYETFSV